MKPIIVLILLVVISNNILADSKTSLKLANIGGLNMEYIDIGKGDINIVVESGVGMGAQYWLPMLPKLEKIKQRIIIYSRVGNGNSSVNPNVSLMESNKRLRSLLTSLNIDESILLVGHSYGGLHARNYAASYEDGVVGMLLLDPSHEGFSHELSKLDREWAENDDKKLNALLVDSPEWINLQKIYKEKQLSDKGAINKIPTVIVTSSKLGESDWWIGHSDRGKAIWRKLHASLISENPNSIHIVTNASGHNMPIEDPDLVVDALIQAIGMIGSP